MPVPEGPCADLVLGEADAPAGRPFLGQVQAATNKGVSGAPVPQVSITRLWQLRTSPVNPQRQKATPTDAVPFFWARESSITSETSAEQTPQRASPPGQFGLWGRAGFPGAAEPDAQRVWTVRMLPTSRGAMAPTPHTGVAPASVVPMGSGVAAKTESGSTAAFTASRRSVFGP